MPSSTNILERLPSVYQPEPGYDDDDLLLQMATAVGSLLDQLSENSAEVMQAHWFDYADSAIYSTWLGRRRKLNSEGPLTLDDPIIDQFPYLFDLPRIAGLVDLSPWREPLRDRERVEAFRTRMRRIIQLHREGLGTVRALRNMTMIALPQVDPDAVEGLRERNFTVEELLQRAPNGEAALTGTAAVLTPVGTLLHDGTEITVGNGEMGTWSARLREQLCAIQSGQANDPHGWRVPLQAS